MLRWSVVFFTCSILGLSGLGCSAPVLAAAEVFPEGYRKKTDIAVMRNAIDRPALLATMAWIRQLAESTKDPAVIAELARLECANADVEREKNKRMALYNNCLETADKALAGNADEIVALYWKAVAMGKLSEEMGILNSLRMTRPMEKLFLRVIALDEHYDNAGGHKALGRMYFRLPGFPVSFGNKEKAVFHLRRALALYPRDIIARAFYAEALYDMGKKQEAIQLAEAIVATPIETENRFRYSRFIEIARNIIEKGR
ncbi:MAG: TRAP transporter TatT component family protein [Nitrosomonas sp.]|nr:TRAP transporter TatT component family protein [Nitrosomonas sp.]